VVSGIYLVCVFSEIPAESLVKKSVNEIAVLKFNGVIFACDAGCVVFL